MLWSYVRTDAFFHIAASGSGAQRRTARNKVSEFVSELGNVLVGPGAVSAEGDGKLDD